MFVLNILCHDLVGYESSRGLGTKLAECRYETSKPGYESSGYERSMGTKRLDPLCRNIHKWFVTCFKAALTLKNISRHESFIYS